MMIQPGALVEVYNTLGGIDKALDYGPDCECPVCLMLGNISDKLLLCQFLLEGDTVEEAQFKLAKPGVLVEVYNTLGGIDKALDYGPDCECPVCLMLGNISDKLLLCQFLLEGDTVEEAQFKLAKPVGGEM